jgi:hypothetical protein
MKIIKVKDITWPMLQAPDLSLQEKFLLDFGMRWAKNYKCFGDKDGC